MPLVWANPLVRDQHMARENERRYQETHQEPQGDGPAAAGASEAGRPVQAASVQPDPIDEPILDSSDPYQVAAAEFSTSRQRKGRQPRVRTRGSDATPARPAKDFGPLADPQLEQLAQRAANVEDQKQLWRDLIKALKKIFPADQANAARERVWARRKMILAERKTVARARKANGTR